MDFLGTLVKNLKGISAGISRVRSQTTLEYMIIVAIVAIVALIGAMLYFKGATGANVGSSTQLVAVGVNGNNVVLVLSKDLPPGVTSGAVMLDNTPLAVSGLDSSPILVDNYPEYVGTLPANSVVLGDTVNGFDFTSGTSVISVLPASNITVLSAPGNVIQP